MDTISALLLTVVIVAVLVIAAVRNPIAKCSRCVGTGRIRSWVWWWRFRVCPRCGGTRTVRGKFGRRD